MIRKVFEELKEDMRRETAKHNVLLFLVKNGKRTHYRILANVINETLAKSAILQGDKKYEIGNTISSSTLRRFFENDFKENAVNDLRFLKSLDKLSIFLGYKDFSDYSTTKEKENIHTLDNHKKSDFELENKEFCERFFEEFIQHFNDIEFQTFVALPKIQIEEIGDFVFTNSPLYARIVKSKEELSKKGISLNNDSQRSNFEIYDIKKIFEDENQKVYDAKEFWYLEFLGPDHEIYLYNKTNIQQYFFRKINDEWKLWNNFNPNSGDIETLFEPSKKII